MSLAMASASQRDEDDAVRGRCVRCVVVVLDDEEEEEGSASEGDDKALWLHKTLDSLLLSAFPALRLLSPSRPPTCMFHSRTNRTCATLKNTSWSLLQVLNAKKRERLFR